MEDLKQPSKQKNRWYKKWWGALLIASMALFFGSALVVRFTTDPTEVKVSESTPVTPQNQAPANNQQNTIKYIQPEWKITNTETIDTKYIVASGYLLNHTGETGVADCNIEFYDREIKWVGGKGFGGRELNPSERYDFTVQVEVEHTGLIAKQNIDCEDGAY